MGNGPSPLDRAREKWGEASVPGAEQQPEGAPETAEQLAVRVLKEHHCTTTIAQFDELLIKTEKLLSTQQILAYFNPGQMNRLTKDAQWDFMLALATILVRRKVISSDEIDL